MIDLRAPEPLQQLGKSPGHRFAKTAAQRGYKQKQLADAQCLERIEAFGNTELGMGRLSLSPTVLHAVEQILEMTRPTEVMHPVQRTIGGGPPS